MSNEASLACRINCWTGATMWRCELPNIACLESYCTQRVQVLAHCVSVWQQACWHGCFSLLHCDAEAVHSADADSNMSLQTGASSDRQG